jgi:hypothetical protein
MYDMMGEGMMWGMGLVGVLAYRALDDDAQFTAPHPPPYAVNAPTCGGSR